MNYCNGYALNGHTPPGTRPHMGDEHTCIAVANIYNCVGQVHMRDEPWSIQPFGGASYCTINLCNDTDLQIWRYRSVDLEIG